MIGLIKQISDVLLGCSFIGGFVSYIGFQKLMCKGI